jgi:hypothetical protein
LTPPVLLDKKPLLNKLQLKKNLLRLMKMQLMQKQKSKQPNKTRLMQLQ